MAKERELIIEHDEEIEKKYGLKVSSISCVEQEGYIHEAQIKCIISPIGKAAVDDAVYLVIASMDAEDKIYKTVCHKIPGGKKFISDTIIDRNVGINKDTVKIRLNFQYAIPDLDTLLYYDA